MDDDKPKADCCADDPGFARPDVSKVAPKVLIASLVGSAVEWYDYFLYGTVAGLVFDKIFFPSTDPWTGLLLSYTSFAIPFFVRPLGGIVFSHIGDKVGRKNTLVVTLGLMGSATVLIGLLPAYDQIGIWAPILLVSLRMVQGLGIGGEWGGALLLAVEYAPPDRRGFFGSIPQTGVTLGMLLGTLSMTLMSQLPDRDFLMWGWRIPFILSAVLIFLGLWIRKGIDETPAFQEARKSGKTVDIPIVDTIKYHWRSVILAVGAKVVETGPFYIFSTFIISYATKTLGFDKATALNAVTLATLVSTVMIPVMGALSDRFGRKTMYYIGATSIVLFAFPYFQLLAQRTVLTLNLTTIITLGLLWPPITAVLGTLFSEIFSTGVRYTGITVGYQLGAALAGGTAPLVATALLRAFDNSYVPIALYIMVCGIVSVVAVSMTKRVME